MNMIAYTGLMKITKNHPAKSVGLVPPHLITGKSFLTLY